MDDEMNVLPISATLEDIAPQAAEDSLERRAEQELATLQSQLQTSELVGPLVKLAKTLD